jgi:hypothetical protein
VSCVLCVCRVCCVCVSCVCVCVVCVLCVSCVCRVCVVCVSCVCRVCVVCVCGVSTNNDGRKVRGEGGVPLMRMRVSLICVSRAETNSVLRVLLA